MKYFNIFLIFCIFNLNLSLSFGKEATVAKTSNISGEVSTCSTLLKSGANIADFLLTNLVVSYALKHILFKGVFDVDTDISEDGLFAQYLVQFFFSFGYLLGAYVDNTPAKNAGDPEFIPKANKSFINKPFYNLVNKLLQDKFESPKMLKKSSKFKDSALVGNDELKNNTDWREFIGKEVIVTEYELLQEYEFVNSSKNSIKSRVLRLTKPNGLKKNSGILYAVNEAAGEITLKGVVGSDQENLTIVLGKHFVRTIDTAKYTNKTTETFFSIKPKNEFKDYKDPFFFTNFYYKDIKSLINQSVEISYISNSGKKLSQRGTLKSLDNYVAVIVSENGSVTGKYKLDSNVYNLRMLNRDRVILDNVLEEINQDCNSCVITHKELVLKLNEKTLDDDILAELAKRSKQEKEAILAEGFSGYTLNYLKMIE